jgi:hypothetical protein
MKKYAKIIDPEKGICEVGIGTDEEFYKQIGMELMDVEQGYNGGWYLPGYVPVPPKTKVVRVFAKDAIWVVTKDLVIDTNTGLTVWEKFKTFLLDSGLWEGWAMQAYLLEENPFFVEFYPKAVSVFGTELVDKVLSASVVDTKTITVVE